MAQPSIHQVQQTVSAHSQHLMDMHRHMEDLNNRGRRRNLSIRGILESVEGPQLQAVVWAIFNTLLGRPPDAPVEMERCHRAMRPRGRDTDPPRVAVCCLVSFTQKEEIPARKTPSLSLEVSILPSSHKWESHGPTENTSRPKAILRHPRNPDDTSSGLVWILSTA